MRAFKLVRVRRDGSLGPLFINRGQRLDIGVWMPAESHPTPGYAFRPGWHCCSTPSAPHLSPKGRVWVEVEIAGYTKHVRPASQGGIWYTASAMQIRGRVSAAE